jgi:dTDP-glucose 4,6-dehydratase
MTKILITGGAGFIGGNFVRFMVNKYPEYYFINIDALTYAGNLESLKDMENKSNYKFIKADITDSATVERLFKEEKVTHIVHFAAESHVDRSIKDPSIFIKTNVLGTQVLLDSAKKYNLTKYLQVSTDEVYGSLDFDQSTFFTEKTPLNPNSPYSASKAGADLLVLSYYETFGLPINITRCSNNYGPYHFPEKLIPLTISRALNDEKIPIYGNGENVRDWLHVIDHCRAIDMVLFKGKIGEVYNVGGHNEKTNLDVVKTVLKILGKPEDLIEFVADRLGHDKRYAIAPDKLENELGFIPTYTFETGIIETIQWYVDNKTWLNNILDNSYIDYYNTFEEKK